MEEYYQKQKKQQEECLQPETSLPFAYKNEFSLKDKENLFKDVYSTIELFNKLVYEARKESKSS